MLLISKTVKLGREEMAFRPEDTDRSPRRFIGQSERSHLRGAGWWCVTPLQETETFTLRASCAGVRLSCVVCEF